MSSAKWFMCCEGSVPEFEGAAGVRGQRGGRHDDHFPDLRDRSVWEPANA